MKTMILTFLLIQVFPVSAVYVNELGIGDVLLVPYYTVNNDLNTLVSVTNTTEDFKAIKINVREGLNGYSVLSYNVYMSPYDSWTFALVPTDSTLDGSIGQESAYQVTSDNSCAPFLQKQRQEFRPNEMVDGPQELSRAREGFIEILEMGELQGEYAAYAHHSSGSGIPANCAAFEVAWQAGGVWDVDISEDVQPGSGGLMAEADIINVAEGINYSIPVVALDGFFAEDSIAHFNPGDSSLSLDAAEALAIVMANNKAYQLSFDRGIDAVSAVLMADELVGTYALDSIVAGKSEAVFVQPTRRFYTSDQGNNNVAPYNLNSDGLLCPTVDDSFDLSQYGGTRVEWLVYGREAQIEISYNFADPPPPRRYNAICDSVYVYQFLNPNEPWTVNNPAAITGSNNHQNLIRLIEGSSSVNTTENGFFIMKFQETRPLVGTDISNDQTIELMGLPILGISLQKFTNAGAVEGLLAQYGGTHKFKSKMSLQEQQD